VLLRFRLVVAVLVDAVAEFLVKALSHFVRHPRTGRIDVEPHVHAGVHLVDVLTTRAAAASEGNVELVFWNFDIVGDNPIVVVVVAAAKSSLTSRGLRRTIIILVVVSKSARGGGLCGVGIIRS